MNNIEIMTTKGNIKFVGRYLPEREEQNWHCYEDDVGTVFYFRKIYMVCVVESKLGTRGGG